jgi:hypothetical protein
VGLFATWSDKHEQDLQGCERTIAEAKAQTPSARRGTLQLAWREAEGRTVDRLRHVGSRVIATALLTSAIFHSNGTVRGALVIVVIALTLFYDLRLRGTT